MRIAELFARDRAPCQPRAGGYVVFELIYSSVACRPFDATELEKLLADARTRNGEAQVTGILLHRGSSFFQLLEGEEAAVQTVFNRIRRDARHEGVRIIRASTKPQRSFTGWSMGFVSLGRSSLPPQPGSHALSSNGTLVDDHEGDALAILDRFRNGEWSGQIR